MQNQVGIINPGSTWSSLPSGALGRRGHYADMNWGTEPAGYLTGMDTEYVICKNTSGSTLTRGTLVKFDHSTPAAFQYVSATCGAGERADGVVDSYVASTVASNEFFLCIRKGPCRLTTSTSTSISAGKALMSAASGKVVEDTLGNGATTVGYAMETVAAAATLFRAYVDLTGAHRAISSRSVAAGGTLTLTALHNNKTILLDTAAGSVVTLPASSGSGMRFRFLISVIATTNSHKIQVANATDVMQGSITTMSDNSNAALTFFTASTSDTITLNRSTTGSVTVGEYVDIEDYASGFFHVTGVTSSTGSEATPFSAAVS